MLESYVLSWIDVVFLLITVGLIFFGNARVKKHFSSEELNPFFNYGWLFKVFFAVIFAYIYIFAIRGGDINAYWKGACCLTDLFYSDPSSYFSEFFYTNRSLGVTHHFNSVTGYPPGWIWREEEAWFATKIISPFAIITYKGFWSATLLISTMGFWIIWAFSVQLNVKESFSRNTILAALFFVPSVNFWCSGINKDSLTFSLTIFIIFLFFSILKWGKSRSFFRLILVVFLMYLIYSLRHYLAYALAVPFILAWMSRYGKRYTERPLLLWIFRLSVYIMVVVSLFFVMNSDKTKELITEANITKSDFSSNPIYSGAKYEIPTTSGAAIEIISILPLAIFTALFRPTFLDTVNASFFINQLESVLLIFLLLRWLVRKNVFSQLKNLLRDELLMYLLIFVILVAFMAGYSSILFGVLVRIRSVALPFLILLLLHDKSSSETSA